MPRLEAEQIAHVAGLVAEYIASQREKYGPRATGLIAAQRKIVERFFPAAVIEEVRVLVLKGERLANPEFYGMLAGLGFKNLPDQSRMAAITLCDVVVSHEPFSDGLLFHELVHVEQYRQLGVTRFAELYVRGFLNGGSYEAIPLERNAYALGERFENNPADTFSVAEEVARWVAEDRF